MRLFPTGTACLSGTTCLYRSSASSPGLPIQLPWELVRKEISTATRLRRFSERNAPGRRNRVAVEDKSSIYPG